MDSHDDATYFSDISPFLTPITGFRSELASDSSFGTASGQLSPNRSYNNSPSGKANRISPNFARSEACRRQSSINGLQDGLEINRMPYLHPFSNSYYKSLDNEECTPSLIEIISLPGPNTKGPQPPAYHDIKDQDFDYERAGTVTLGSPPYEAYTHPFHTSTPMDIGKRNHFASTELPIHPSPYSNSISLASKLSTLEEDSQYGSDKDSKSSTRSSVMSSDGPAIHISPVLATELSKRCPSATSFTEAVQRFVDEWTMAKALADRAVIPSETTTRHEETRSGDAESTVRFACPYYQRNPSRHQKYRSCASPRWEAVRRVKEHVYRAHMLPLMCQRCSETFENPDDLEKHSKELAPCEVKHIRMEGCSELQKRQLRSRKGLPGQTEAQKWQEMYRILFPTDQRKLSPYYQPNNECCHRKLEDFKKHIMESLPSKIQEDVDKQTSSKIPKFKSRTPIKVLVRSHIQELFDKYPFPKPLSSDPGNPKPGVKLSGRPGLEVNHRAGLSVGAFGRTNYAQNPTSRRRANSEVSPESKTTSPFAKKVAAERAEEQRERLMRYGVP